MKLRNLLLLSLLTAGVLGAGVIPAWPACSQTGTLVYSYINEAAPRKAFFYLAPVATPTIYYYCSTTDPQMVRYLTGALVGRRSVFVYGNASSCPGSGDFRNMGTVIKVFIDTEGID